MNAMTTVEQTVYIPARMGASISVSEGTLIRLTDLYGQQPDRLLGVLRGELLGISFAGTHSTVDHETLPGCR